jgi:hypothetical protein
VAEAKKEVAPRREKMKIPTAKAARAVVPVSFDSIQDGSKAKNHAILLALIPAIAVVVAALIGAGWWVKDRGGEVTCSGRIFNAANDLPIPNAKVALEMSGIVLVHYSDSEGFFSFSPGSSSEGSSGLITVDAPGFRRFVRNIQITRLSGPNVFKLERDIVSGPSSRANSGGTGHTRAGREVATQPHGVDGHASLTPASGTTSNDSGNILHVRVQQQDGTPIIGADVLAIAEDGTVINTTTGPDGRGDLSRPNSRPFTIYCARENFAAVYDPDVDPTKTPTLSIKMTPKPQGGSLAIIDGTGYVPGLQGRLNPILNASQSYLYADNMSIEGRSQQPYVFTIGKSFKLRDSEGHQFELTVLSIKGRSSLIEYSRL